MIEILTLGLGILSVVIIPLIIMIFMLFSRIIVLETKIVDMKEFDKSIDSKLDEIFNKISALKDDLHNKN